MRKDSARQLVTTTRAPCSTWTHPTPQAYSVVVVALGLVTFALVLALVEQVVLASLEENVQRGSRVFEQGHTLVLCFGVA